jgi:hypothetical protein
VVPDRVFSATASGVPGTGAERHTAHTALPLLFIVQRPRLDPKDGRLPSMHASLKCIPCNEIGWTLLIPRGKIRFSELKALNTGRTKRNKLFKASELK